MQYMYVFQLWSFLHVIQIFEHNIGRMMNLVAFPPWKLVLPINAEGVAIAQATTSMHA